MSAPYELHDSPLLPYARILSYFSPRQPNGKPDWRNLEAAIDHVEYPFFPTRSIADLVDFLSAMRSCLPEVKIPALLVHSRSDEGVPPENALQNFEHLGSADKEIFWVENSGHVICKEPERQRAFDAIGAFIERTLSKPK
jgi:esterase/lipase